MINIKIKYFASLREALSIEEQSLVIEPGLSIQALWQQLHPELELNDAIKVAVDFAYVSKDYILNKDVEVAFFPPVTGG